MQKQVIKRDGSIELYEEVKIERILVTAGLTMDQAHALALDVTNWFNSLSDTNVSSLQLRDKILELLPTVNKSVADFYRWYQKTKEKSS